ncbi:COG3650 family protein [Flavisphingopyxis soli]|uniref:COG3650 family protein n=1 Tax=Flavisphingopyxis soli TaxID=2601267 RepID=UPI00191BE1E0|nr:hypothetical protein [Sphingorhabdus soli]
MTSPLRFALPLAALIALSACQPSGNEGASGDVTQVQGADDKQPFNGIASTETLHVTGTEPFWGGTVTGDTVTYTTPENQAGEAIPVHRFAGRGGVSFTGLYNGADFALMVTPGTCSDGMSDRTYPFTVTLKLAEDVRRGCGWGDAHPVTDPNAAEAAVTGSNAAAPNAVDPNAP